MCRRLDLQLLLMREIGILLKRYFLVQKEEIYICGTERGNIYLVQIEEMYIWYKKKKYIFVVQKEEIYICGTKRGNIYLVQK